MTIKKLIKNCFPIHYHLLISIIIILIFFNNAQAAYSPPYLKNNNGASIPVLMYHRIIDGNNPPRDRASADIEKSIFNNQIKFLKNNGYTSLSLDELNNKLNNCPLPNQGKTIVLTFDDGYQDFYDNAYPILQEYNMQATVFMIVQAIGDPDPSFSTNRHLNLSEIQEMESSGLVKIESHTMSHKNLASLNYSAIIYEIEKSKNILEGDLGRTIRYISYPYGGSNSTVRNTAGNYYDLAFDVKQGNASCSSNKNNIERHTVKNESFISQSTRNNYYMPYIPDPRVRASKIKLKMCQIINGSNHSAITRQSKINFFDWLEKTNYFWLDQAGRQQIRQEILYSQDNTFNDGTPWAYVLGDGENAVKSLLGSADDGNITRIKYSDSINSYPSIISQSEKNNSYASIFKKIIENLVAPKAKAETTNFSFNAAINPYKQENNQSNMFEFSSLSIDQQENVYNQIKSTINNYTGGGIDINKIKVGNSTSSFTSSDGDSSSLFYIYDDNGNLIINEKLFLFSNSTEQQETLMESFNDWLAI
jgi:peptidoglycan/xylan/chitin deacetylase (PgdA/CDA1 family)